MRALRPARAHSRTPSALASPARTRLRLLRLVIRLTQLGPGGDRGRENASRVGVRRGGAGRQSLGDRSCQSDADEPVRVTRRSTNEASAARPVGSSGRRSQPPGRPARAPARLRRGFGGAARPRAKDIAPERSWAPVAPAGRLGRPDSAPSWLGSGRRGDAEDRRQGEQDQVDGQAGQDECANER